MCVNLPKSASFSTSVVKDFSSQVRRIVAFVLGDLLSLISRTAQTQHHVHEMVRGRGCADISKFNQTRWRSCHRLQGGTTEHSSGTIPFNLRSRHQVLPWVYQNNRPSGPDEMVFNGTLN